MFVTSEPSFLLYYPSGGGDSFMIQMLHGWLSSSIINYKRRRPHDLHHALSGHVSPFWRGVLKASIAFESGIKIGVGKVA